MDKRDELTRIHEAREKRERKKRLRILIIFAILLIIVSTVIALTLRCILQNITGNNESSNPVETTAPQLRTYEPTIEPTAEPTPEPTPEPINRRGRAEAIPPEIRQTMAGYSMPSDSTISYDELSYLTIPHYDFNYNVAQGHLVVNREVAEEVLDIFAELFDIQYPIERMELIDKYGADDYTSIDYNNTSAFNYRVSTDGSGRLSRHALGRAIDINPQINPYVSSDGTGSHPNAREYWSRNTASWTSDVAKAAYIGTDTEIYRIFTRYGWEWGGSWSSYRDYQHFQKPQ